MNPSYIARCGIAAVVCASACLPGRAQTTLDVPSGSTSIDPANYAESLEKTGEGTLILTGNSNLGSGFSDYLYAHAGTLVLSGTVSDGVGSVGMSPGSATVEVNGNGVWRNNQMLFVGEEGKGTLNIVGSGSVYAANAIHIAHSSGVTGVINVGGNGALTNDGDLFVASLPNSTGTLAITGRGSVTSTGMGVVGHQAGSTGVLDVSENGTLTMTARGLTIGNNGTGTLIIRDDAVARISNVTIASAPNGNGTLTLLGGVLETGGVQKGATPATARVTLNGGTIRASGGSTDFFRGFSALKLQGVDLADTRTALTFDTGIHGVTIATGLDFVRTASSDDTFRALEKIGTGRLTLSGSSDLVGANYNGGVFINAGTLAVTNYLKDYIGVIAEGVGSTAAVIVSGTGRWASINTLTVGQEGSATLNISGNGLVTSAGAQMAVGQNAIAQATLTGSGYWNNVGDLSMGGDDGAVATIDIGATAKMDILGYASIGTAEGSSGLVRVGGTFASIRTLYVGESGSGTLNVDAGGAVLNGGKDITLGLNADGSGLMNVRGRVEAYTLEVGGEGQGELIVAGAGYVSSFDGIIGDNGAGADGSVTITDAGYWNVMMGLHIGNAGAGELTIEKSGSASHAMAYIGTTTSGSGAVTVRDDGVWTGLALTIGENGMGSLTLEDKARVRIRDVILMGGDSGDGTLNLLGGVLESSGLQKGNGDASILINGGTIRALAESEDFLANFATDDVVISGSGLAPERSALVFDTQFYSVSLTNNLSFTEGTASDTLRALEKIGDGTLTLSGDSDLGGGRIYVNGGEVEVTGALGSADVVLAESLGQYGSARIDSGGHWTSDGNFVVGRSGDGMLSVGEDSKLTVHGLLTMGEGAYASGYMGIDGSNSVVEHIGNTAPVFGSAGVVIGGAGRASAFVTNGGTFTTDGNIIIGRDSSSSASVFISGAGSEMYAEGSIYISKEGRGSLAVTDDGLVTASIVQLAQFGGNGATLTLARGGTIATSQITGDFWGASLDINGGVIVSREHCADFFSGFGEITLNGANVDVDRAVLAFNTDVGQMVEITNDLTFDPVDTFSTKGFEKQGAGVLVLSGDIDFHDGYIGTAIDGGQLILTGEIEAGFLGASANSLVTIEHSGTRVFAGQLMGSGMVAKSGDGTLELAGNNSEHFAGTLDLWAGVLKVRNTDNLGANTVLSGASILSIDGATDFVFSAANSSGGFYGTVRVENGTLFELNESSGNNLAMLQTAALELADGGFAVVREAGTHISDLTFNGGTLDIADGLELPPSEMLHVDGTLTALDGTITINSSAFVTSGSVPETPPFADQDNFMGQSTTLNEDSVLLVGADAIAGDLTQIKVMNESGLLTSGSHTVAYHNDGGDYVLDAYYDYTAITGTYSGTAGLWLTYALTRLDVMEGRLLELNIDRATNNTLAAAITGSGGLHITNSGMAVPGTDYVILSNASNTFTGETIIDHGSELRGGNVDVIASSTAVWLMGESVFNTGGYNQAIQSLNSNSVSAAVVVGGDSVLTLSGSSDGDFFGTISGSGALVKTGTSTQYVGAIAVEGLTYIKEGYFNTGDIAGNVLNEASLRVANHIGGTLATGSNSFTDVANGVGGDVLNSGTLVMGGFIEGSMINYGSGHVVVMGDVAGGLQNAGYIAWARDVYANGLINTGTIDRIGNVVGGIRNSGKMVNAGTVTGDVVNLGYMEKVTGVIGNLFNSGTYGSSAPTGQVTGDVYNSGTAAKAEFDASILGNVINEGFLATYGGGIGGWLSTGSASTTSINGGVGGHVVNEGTLIIHGAVEGGVLNKDTGYITQISSIAQGLDNAGWVEQAGDVLAGGAVNRESGVITQIGTITGGLHNSGHVAKADGVLSDGVYNASTGVIESIGDITGDVINAGRINEAGDVTGNVLNSGTIEQIGSISKHFANSTAASFAYIAGDVAETVVNLGTLSVDGDIGQGLANSGTANLGGNILSGGVANLAGTATIHGTASGTVRNSAGAFLTIGDTITGEVINSGSLHAGAGLAAITGTAIQGNLSNSGVATIHGVVTGHATNSGKLYAQGQLASGLTNSGLTSFDFAGTVISGSIINTGIIALAPGSSTFAGNLSGQAGTIRYGDAISRLTINGDLGGSQTFANVRVNLSNNAHPLVLDISGAVTGAHKLMFVKDPASSTPVNPETFSIALVKAGEKTPSASFTGAVDDGLWTYQLAKGDGSILMPGRDQWYLSRGALNCSADAILGTAGILGADWHYTLDSLYLRMGDLRANPQLASLDTGNLWVRTNAYRLNAGSPVTGRPFEQNTYGVTVGGDKSFPIYDGLLLAGGFLQMGHSDRDHDYYRGDSNSNTLGAGGYVTALFTEGWFADATFKFDRIKNKISVRGVDGLLTEAEYNNQVQGMGLELGRRLKKNGYWLEPSAQIAVAWINGADYTATNGLQVSIADSTAWQYRFQVRAGANYGPWSPYLKFGAVNNETDGGEVRAQGRVFATDFDGWRMEAGAGLGYSIDARSQLYVDYEYARSDNYERPWAFNLGYRRAW